MIIFYHAVDPFRHRFYMFITKLFLSEKKQQKESYFLSLKQHKFENYSYISNIFQPIIIGPRDENENTCATTTTTRTSTTTQPPTFPTIQTTYINIGKNTPQPFQPYKLLI